MKTKTFICTFTISAMALFFSGCISAKTDAFLLGAGIGAGTAYYFMEGGKIDGISKKSLQYSLNKNLKTSQNPLPDYSIPSELEWYYFEEDFRRSLHPPY